MDMRDSSMTNKKRETTWAPTEHTSMPMTHRERSDTEKQREMSELCNPTEPRASSAIDTATSSQVLDNNLAHNVVETKHAISVEAGDDPDSLKHQAPQDYQRGLLLRQRSIQLLEYSRELYLASALLMHDDPASIAHKRRNSTPNYELFINDLAKEKNVASPSIAGRLQKDDRARPRQRSDGPHDDCDDDEKSQSAIAPPTMYRRRKSIANCQLFVNDLAKAEVNSNNYANAHQQGERKRLPLMANDHPMGDQHQDDSASRTSDKSRSPTSRQKAQASSAYASHRRLKAISRHEVVNSALARTDNESCSGDHKSSPHQQDTDAQSQQPKTTTDKTPRRRIRSIPTYYRSNDCSAEKEGEVSFSALRSPRDVQEKQHPISTHPERAGSFDMQRSPTTDLASTHHVRARSVDALRSATTSMSYQQSSKSPPGSKHKKTRTPSILEKYYLPLTEASIPPGDGNHSALECQPPESVRAPSSAINHHARARSSDIHPKQTNTGPSHSRTRSLGDDHVTAYVSTHPLISNEQQSVPKQLRHNTRRERTKSISNFNHQLFQNTTQAEPKGGDLPSRRWPRAVSPHEDVRQTVTTSKHPRLSSSSLISTQRLLARSFDDHYRHSAQVLSENHGAYWQPSHNTSPRKLGTSQDMPSSSDACPGQHSEHVTKSGELMDITRTHHRSPPEVTQKKTRGKQKKEHSSIPSILLPKTASRKKSAPLPFARCNQHDGQDSRHCNSLAHIFQAPVTYSSSSNATNTPNVLLEDESHASCDASEAPPTEQQRVAIIDFPPRPRQSTLLKSASWSDGNDDDALLVSRPAEIPLLSVALLDSL